MAFFEDLGKKVSQTSQDAIKKTKIMAETSKLNSQISGERKVISDSYGKIGEKYFELFRDNPDESLALYVTAVKEALVKIEDLEQQIHKLKGIGCCPGCGIEIKEGISFCPNCGMKIEQPAPEVEQAPAATARACANCSAPLTDGTRFCGICGTKTE